MSFITLTMKCGLQQLQETSGKKLTWDCHQTRCQAFFFEMLINFFVEFERTANTNYYLKVTELIIFFFLGRDIFFLREKKAHNFLIKTRLTSVKLQCMKHTYQRRLLYNKNGLSVMKCAASSTLREMARKPGVAAYYVLPERALCAKKERRIFVVSLWEDLGERGPCRSPHYEFKCLNDSIITLLFVRKDKKIYIIKVWPAHSGPVGWQW